MQLASDRCTENTVLLELYKQVLCKKIHVIYHYNDFKITVVISKVIHV